MIIKGNFGRLIQRLRRENNWTVQELINKIGPVDGRPLSLSYISKVEIYNEIPKPNIVFKLAEAFGKNEKELLDLAKQEKIEDLKIKLEAKYDDALVFYRKTKKGTR
ncbi:MAG: helix-turn-helix domain-containing protein [Elusimicrobia bacterium]|nr:helix-turn-helix domain-containing protein [Elusimicrobiota bacterium]